MLSLRRVSAGLLLGIVLLPCTATRAAEPIRPPVPTGWLGLERVDRPGRAPFNPSAVFERYLWKPDAPPPKAGEAVTGASGKEAVWTALTPNAKGEIQGRGLGLAYATLEADAAQARIWLAEIRRIAVLYVNGVPVGGDVYGHGITKVPLKLREGTNHLFAAGFRGPGLIRLDYASERQPVGRWDATLPEIVPGEHTGMTAGILLVNATEATRDGLEVEGTILVEREDGDAARYHLRPRHPIVIPPLGSAKVSLRSVNVALPKTAKQAWLAVVVRRHGRVLENHAWDLEVRDPDEAYRVTFRSGIDDSAQYYAVRRPTEERSLGAVLTLHGAGVDALNQARAYSPKKNHWIVAPTNRRPFGFDWQDWGRQDAYEVMADLSKLTGVVTPYLTGHSMGGHGTWHLAVNDPGRFRAIAPSAGWCSFDTYGGRPQGKLRDLWHAADAASNTEALLPNLRHTRIFVLHGTDDDNVPLSEAEHLVASLKTHGIEPQVHFEEGKVHWWDGDAAEGADCVDWPAIFETFREAASPVPTSSFAWTVADLSLGAEHDGWRIEQPMRYGAPSRLDVDEDRERRVLRLRTENVRRLVGLRCLRPRSVVIDEQPVSVRARGEGEPPVGVTFLRDADTGAWREAVAKLPAGEKYPRRMGPFKRAFDNRFVLVYGTAGQPEEDEALLASARYDAEQWRYRANGRAECVTDAFFLAHPERYADRNVILYGNATTNSAWNAALDPRCPVHAERGRIRMGDRQWTGESLGLLLVYPRRGSDLAQVAVVGDTGVLGTRLAFRMPYFTSGVGIPDYVVYGADVLGQGDEGVRAAGFFDYRWELVE